MNQRVLCGVTIATRAGQYIDATASGLTPRIQPSVTFACDEDNSLTNAALIYDPTNCPTTDAAESLLDDLKQTLSDTT